MLTRSIWKQRISSKMVKTEKKKDIEQWNLDKNKQAKLIETILMS